MADLIEPFGVADTFVSGLGEVENVGGGCLRFTFYAQQTISGHVEYVVVAKLVAPKDAIPPALAMAAHAIGMKKPPCDDCPPFQVH